MKGYKYRIYPNKAQQKQIRQNINAARFAYNVLLKECSRTAKENRRIPSLSHMMHMSEELHEDKRYPWLANAQIEPMYGACGDLANAFHKYWHGEAKHPKFKKYSDKDTYRMQNTHDSMRITDDHRHIIFPGLGSIRASVSRLPQGKIRSGTITACASGRYYISLCTTDRLARTADKPAKEIALDMGLAEFYTDSNGKKVYAPKPMKKYERHIALEQKKLCRMRTAAKERKVPLSQCRNYQKQKRKLARIYEKTADTRIDFIQKTSTDIARENMFVYLENLNIQEMLKTKKYAHSIQDVSWSEFQRILKYKVGANGGRVIQVDTFYPSSQICSVCGFRNQEIKDTHIRKWVCPVCGAVHDRDENAAKNILAEGIRKLNEKGRPAHSISSAATDRTVQDDIHAQA